MSSQLKKEFKKADVERMRNLIKKDYTSGTKLQNVIKKVISGKNRAKSGLLKTVLSKTSLN